MRKIIILLFIINISYVLFSQNTAPLVASYSYNNFKLKESSDVILFIRGGESLSIFKRRDSVNNSIYTDEEYLTRFNLQGNDEKGKQVYKNLDSKKIIFRDYISKSGKFFPCIVEEDLPILKWEITNLEKKIDKFECKLANLTFRGRSYEVWFTTDIPIVHGPWKFYGLPGMIVEIYSKDKNIHFLLKSVKNLLEDVKIKKPINGDKITFQEYVNYKNNAVEDFLKKLYTKLPRGAQIYVNYNGNHNLEKSFGENK